MFLGEYTHTTDEKGRVTIPSRFRDDLLAGLVVARGFDQNLMVFPLAGWIALADEVASRPLTDEGILNFRRRVFSGAVDLKPDKQGRILLPQYLREFAGIDGEVVFAGNYNYVEIWDAAAWQRVRQDIESSDATHRWRDLGI